MRSLFSRAALSFLTLLALGACGGGDASSSPTSLRQHVTSISGEYAVKRNVRVEVAAMAESFGADISSMTWTVEPLGDARGLSLVADPSCSRANRRTRNVPDSDKSVTVVECKTTVQIVDELAAARGPFLVTSTVALSTGESNSVDFILKVD